MITSALISECRREFGDQPKTTRLSRSGNGTINLFNTGKYPIIEGSYTVRQAGTPLVEGTTSGFTVNLDNGDILVDVAPGSGVEITADLQSAEWRDRNWLEAINGAVQSLNARGFFRQVVREPITISGSVRTFSGPTDAIDAYELLYTPGPNQEPMKLGQNWSYQQDANKFVLGAAMSSRTSGLTSYLRNMRTYTATSATLDVKDDWIELVKKQAGSNFYRFMAGKIAKQGNANIDEGHFSFTNLRTTAADLESDFEKLALRKKPTRPAKDIQFAVQGGGFA
jgi:hypothetical protein